MWIWSLVLLHGLLSTGIYNVLGTKHQWKEAWLTSAKKYPNAVLVMRGRKATLPCLTPHKDVLIHFINGEYLWQDSLNRSIADSRFSVLGSGELSLNDAQPGDTGRYRCEAKNDKKVLVGIYHHHLLVYELPIFTYKFLYAYEVSFCDEARDGEKLVEIRRQLCPNTTSDCPFSAQRTCQSEKSGIGAGDFVTRNILTIMVTTSVGETFVLPECDERCMKEAVLEQLDQSYKLAQEIAAKQDQVSEMDRKFLKERFTKDTANDCPAGYHPFQSVVCLPCMPGSYTVEGSYECKHCQRNFYQPKFAATMCFPCPEQGITKHTGTIGAFDCKEDGQLEINLKVNKNKGVVGLIISIVLLVLITIFGFSAIGMYNASLRTKKKSLDRDEDESHLLDPLLDENVLVNDEGVSTESKNSVRNMNEPSGVLVDLESDTDLLNSRDLLNDSRKNSLRSANDSRKNSVVVDYDSRNNSLVAEYDSRNNSLVSENDYRKGSPVAGYESRRDSRDAGYDSRRHSGVAGYDSRRDSHVAGYDSRRDSRVPGYDSRRDSRVPGYDSRRDSLVLGYDSRKDSFNARGHDSKKNSVAPGYDARENSQIEMHDSRKNNLAVVNNSRKSSLSDKYDSRNRLLAGGYDSRKHSLVEKHDSRRKSHVEGYGTRKHSHVHGSGSRKSSLVPRTGSRIKSHVDRYDSRKSDLASGYDSKTPSGRQNDSERSRASLSMAERHSMSRRASLPPTHSGLQKQDRISRSSQSTVQSRLSSMPPTSQNQSGDSRASLAAAQSSKDFMPSSFHPQPGGSESQASLFTTRHTSVTRKVSLPPRKSSTASTVLTSGGGFTEDRSDYPSMNTRASRRMESSTTPDSRTPDEHTNQNIDQYYSESEVLRTSPITPMRTFQPLSPPLMPQCPSTHSGTSVPQLQTQSTFLPPPPPQSAPPPQGPPPPPPLPPMFYDERDTTNFNQNAYPHNTISNQSGFVSSCASGPNDESLQAAGSSHKELWRRLVSLRVSNRKNTPDPRRKKERDQPDRNPSRSRSASPTPTPVVMEQTSRHNLRRRSRVETSSSTSSSASASTSSSETSCTNMDDKPINSLTIQAKRMAESKERFLT